MPAVQEQAAGQQIPAELAAVAASRGLGLVEMPPDVERALAESAVAPGSARNARQRAAQLTKELRSLARSTARGGATAAPEMDPRTGMRLRGSKGKVSWKHFSRSLEKSVGSGVPEDLEGSFENLDELNFGGELAAERSAPSYDALQAGAYVSARMPACYAVLYRIFAELEFRLPGFEPRRMLDFGAGPGTAIWAAQEVWGGKLREVLAVEPSNQMAWLGRQRTADLLVLVEPGTPIGSANIREARTQVLDAERKHADEAYSSSNDDVDAASDSEVNEGVELSVEERWRQTDPHAVAGAIAATSRWSRIIRTPRKRGRHVMIDVCAAHDDDSGTGAQGVLLNQIVGRADRQTWLGPRGYRFARASRWGDLWPTHYQERAITQQGPGS
ncbi:hypothetical protein WJX72_009470 [[Myrmecia] bisecta]|uniref:Uncharacterized protein n=1 Tax=[Myrmecia] bisecta TaxID=41462 RepID=A0AAW1Q9Z6_9CHLO